MMSLRTVCLALILSVSMVACGGSDQPTGQPLPDQQLPPGSSSQDPSTNPGAANPTGPTDPSNPADPANPTDPTDPADPTDPSSPSNPSNPSNPSPPPSGTGITAHQFPGCVPDLFWMDIGELESTCDNHWTVAEDMLQVIFKDNNGLPATGRTYAVKSQSQVNLYPADGEVTALFLPQGGGAFEGISGTVTIDPITTAGMLTGSYNIQLANGNTISNGYRADICPGTPEDCD